MLEFRTEPKVAEIRAGLVRDPTADARMSITSSSSWVFDTRLRAMTSVRYTSSKSLERYDAFCSSVSNDLRRGIPPYRTYSDQPW